jgi:hypothetical protein
VGPDDPQRQEIVVWRLAEPAGGGCGGCGGGGAEGLRAECRLPQPAGRDVRALLGVEGGLWAAVGMEVVVFGPRPTGHIQV